MIIYLALNELHMEVALSHNVEKNKTIYFDANRVSVSDKLKTLPRTRLVRLTKISSVQFVLLTMLMPTYIPHMKIGFLGIFLNFKRLLLIDDGLDFFRYQPRCLTQKNLYRTNEYLTLVSSGKTPDWLPEKVKVLRLNNSLYLKKKKKREK